MRHQLTPATLLLALLATAALAVSACSGDSSSPSNSDAGITVTTDGGGDCGEGMAFCGGECVDTSSNPSHCGQCGNTCQSGNTCVDGSCSQQPEDCREEPCRGLTYCDLNTGNCKPGCSSDDQCGNNEQCETAAHECVCVSGTERFKGSCVDEQSCNEQFCDGNQYCDLQAGECRSGCHADSQCGSGEQCDTSSNECVCESGKTRFNGECVNEQECNERFCSGDQYCDLQAGTCRSGCHANDQCGDNQVCDTSSNECVCDSGTERFKGECLDESSCNDQFCGEYEYCDFSSSTCASGCHSDSQCGRHGDCDTSTNECECDTGYAKVGYGCLDKTTTVESGQDLGWYASLAVDDSGGLHIAHYDSNNENLEYAHWDGRSWNKKTFNDSNNQGEYTDITVDTSGEPHIVYKDETADKLMYTYGDNGNWKTEVADDDPNAGDYASIALDGSGDAHIAHFNLGDDAFQYTEESFGSWETETIGQSISGAHTSIDIDSSGDPGVAYAHSQPRSDVNRYEYGVSFARPGSFGSSSWSNETLDSDIRDEGAALAFDSSDNAHIAYMNRGRVYYAEQTSSGWDYKELGSADPDTVDIALDSSGDPHIVYQDRYDLKHADGSFGSWDIDEVDGPSGAGIGPDIEIHDGRAFVVHRVARQDDLLLSIIDL